MRLLSFGGPATLSHGDLGPWLCVPSFRMVCLYRLDGSIGGFKGWFRGLSTLIPETLDFH